MRPFRATLSSNGRYPIMTTEWHDLDIEDGPMGTLEFDPIGLVAALELHLWQRDEQGHTTGVWLNEDGVVLRVVRSGSA